MTRKHFIALARIIKNAKDSDANAYREGEDMREELAKQIATFCEDENQNFDREKFLKACEI